MNALWITPVLGSALAMAVAVAQPQDADSITPDLAKAEMLDIFQDQHQRYTVPVTIDGAGPYDFLIDTGSQATVVTHEINDRLALPSLGSVQLVGMASTRIVPLVEIGNLRLGSQVVHDLAAPVLERDHIGADGIIGLDSLQDTRVLFDFRKGTIAVENTADKASTRGFEIVVSARSKSGRLLITDAIVEGVRATVIIDTGAQGSMGNLALQQKIGARRQQEIMATDVNGVTETADLSVTRRLTIQDFSLVNVPIAYSDAPAFEVLGLKDKPALSMGMEHLKLFDRVAIDFSKRRVLFDLPRGAARDMRRPGRTRM